MTGFFQLLISGVMVGSIYGLLALGFVLIYKSSHIFNFAIGAMLMLSAYIAYSMMSGLGLPYWLAVILTIIISMAIGALFERWPLRPLIGQPTLSIIMVTIAISSLISGSLLGRQSLTTRAQKRIQKQQVYWRMGLQMRTQLSCLQVLSTRKSSTKKQQKNNVAFDAFLGTLVRV